MTRPRKRTGPHTVTIERGFRDGQATAQAVCTCGWKGRVEKFFRTAHTAGARHKGNAGDD